MRFLLNLGEVSALQSLRVKKSWHLRQGCMKIHRLASVDACFSSPPARPSKMHVFFSLLGCLQLFYHWQAGMALRRYQMEPECINQGSWGPWVKRQGQGLLINANAKANTRSAGFVCSYAWDPCHHLQRGGKKGGWCKTFFMGIWQTKCPFSKK